MSNSFGNLFRFTVFGQSHAPAIGVTIEGLPPGSPVDLAALQAFLDRRAPGKSPLSTSRRETDAPELLSGLGPDGNYRRDGSAAYYLSEEVVEDEQKGVGVCMMAYAEYLKLRALCPEAGPEVSLFLKKYDPIMPDEIARLEAEKKR